MKKKFSKKLKVVLLISVLVILLTSVVILAIDSWSTGWRVYPGTQKVITVSTGDRYQITNNCAYGLFIPTKVFSEWFSFSSSRPSCTSYCQTFNGGWSEWSACTASESCGGRCGTVVTSGTQTRSCTNPTPVCGGDYCDGSTTQSCTYTYSCGCSDGEYCNSATGYCEPTEFTE